MEHTTPAFVPAPIAWWKVGLFFAAVMISIICVLEFTSLGDDTMTYETFNPLTNRVENVTVTIPR